MQEEKCSTGDLYSPLQICLSSKVHATRRNENEAQRSKGGVKVAEAWKRRISQSLHPPTHAAVGHGQKNQGNLHICRQKWPTIPLPSQCLIAGPSTGLTFRRPWGDSSPHARQQGQAQAPQGGARGQRPEGAVHFIREPSGMVKRTAPKEGAVQNRPQGAVQIM